MYPDFGASMLDFSSLSPRGIAMPQITLDFGETNTSICDSDGQLLFYSNGMAIDGPEHKPIINGDTINFRSGWNTLIWQNEHDEWKSNGHRFVQSVGFIPLPDHLDTTLAIYQNYTRTGSTGYFDLQYGKITLNDEGRYEIYDKDLSINDRIGDPGNVHACRHANGRDWWMLQFARDTVYTYLIDPTGIQLSHLQFLPFELQHANRGQSKFNQQGTRFALTHVIQDQLPDGMEIFIADFDRSTGNLSNHVIAHTSSFNTALEQGLEFSPSGRYLYITRPQFVFQIDMNDLPIVNLDEVAFFPDELCELDDFFLNRFGQLQLAPDNKIYIGRTSQCFDIHVINHPNRAGVACDVQRNAIKLPTYTDGTIPNFNTYRLGPLDGSSADTLGLDNNPVSRFWYEQDSIDFLTSQFWDCLLYTSPSPRDRG